MRLRRAFVTVLAFALSSLALVPAAFAQFVRIPGTTVTLTSPPGFRISRAFPGLENAQTGSTIKVEEFPPEAYTELASAFSSPKTAASRFASQGIHITRVDQLAAEAGQVPFAIGGQMENGKEVVKYLAAMGGAQTSTKTVLITFSVTSMDRLSRNDVEAVVQSVKLGRIASLDEKVARLTFTFRAVPPFHTLNADGDSAVLTSANQNNASDSQPAIVINRDNTTASPGEAVQLGEKLMRSIAGFGTAQISAQAPTTFAGGQGVVVSTVAENLTLLQFIRVFPGGRYIQLAARGDTAAIEKVRDAITEIARSIQIKE